MAGLSLIDFGAAAFVELSYLPLVAALSLSVVLILFGSGPGSSSAKVNLGPVQPIEAIRLLLALFLAGYFARRWELLRELRSRVVRDVRLPEWINLPRGEYALPVVAGVGLALVFFFLQKDLGPALFLCCVFLAMYAVARGRVGMAITGLLLLVLGFYAGYRLHLSPTLADRVRMWQSPWDNAVAGGDQVAHAIWGMATGGWFGTGLGLGDSRYLPAGHTDLILAAIGEELGAAGLTLVAVLYAHPGLARDPHRTAGAKRLRLLSRHGAHAVPDRAGLDHGVGHSRRDTADRRGDAVSELRRVGDGRELCRAGNAGRDSRRPASRQATSSRSACRCSWLGGALGLCALALLAVMLNVQIVHGDDYVVRPHLGVQADGGRRFEYNPRVLDVVRLMPRGTIYDRHGLPLATDDREGASPARARPMPNSASRSPTRVRMPANDAIRSAAARFTCSATRGRARTGARRIPLTSSAMPRTSCAVSTIMRRPFKQPTPRAGRC